MMNDSEKDKRCTERLERVETHRYRCCAGRCIPTDRKPKKDSQMLFEVCMSGQKVRNTGNFYAVVVQDGLGMYRQRVWNDKKSNWMG